MPEQPNQPKISISTAHELLMLVQAKIINIPEARRMLLGEDATPYPEPMPEDKQPHRRESVHLRDVR